MTSSLIYRLSWCSRSDFVYGLCHWMEQYRNVPQNIACIMHACPAVSSFGKVFMCDPPKNEETVLMPAYSTGGTIAARFPPRRMQVIFAFQNVRCAWSMKFNFG